MQSSFDFFSTSKKNTDTIFSILSFQAMQEQVADQIRSMGYSFANSWSRR